MSGHNKWSKIKHQKEATDVKKGKIYTMYAKKIMMAYHAGKGMVQAVSQAKVASVPKEVIERAITKGTVNSENVKEVIFEAFFLNGKINLIILGETDNTTRTSNQVKNVLEKSSGRLGNPGSTAYLFKKYAKIYIPRNEGNLNYIMESGADDFNEEGEYIIVTAEFDKYHRVVDFLKQKNIEIFNEETEYCPETEVSLKSEELQKYNNLISDLNMIGEIVSIFSNVKN